ncbi:hypothetical protein GCM10010145_67530 [Streptomyces ruber]|uniref:Uncharacterized protein n=2 Tax=Streptomyces TaxID=1883 RepID=A0A918BRK9_9ACTN|nr:hypothetical protein GCM10010145_67530 [Streptomyces ruber]
MVGLTGGPEGRTLIRRAARLAEKGAGGEVLALCMARSDGLTSASIRELALQRTLVEDLGGTFHHVVGEDIPTSLLEFARGVNATQIVLGVSRRKGWQYVSGPGVGATVAHGSGPDLDVRLITHDAMGSGRGLPAARGARLGRARIVAGWLVGVLGPALLTLLLSAALPDVGLAPRSPYRRPPPPCGPAGKRMHGMTTVDVPATHAAGTELSVWPVSTTQPAPGDLAVGGVAMRTSSEGVCR